MTDIQGRPPSDLDETRAQESRASSADTIGPYRLLQKLGEGGMGIVWLAEQVKPVRRKVALKIIKAGMDTSQVVARFEAERQALALMDHSGIARVFEAGATDQGRPYFAMEYVRGESITAYCALHKLSIRERIDLFLQVCDAVQHAHQKGIIHRDLKPSNVLVMVQGDHPVPKIIDFGVAKAMSQPLTDRTLLTELGTFIGTPEYMSPEQAEMSGLDVDTRTDVYSLGAMLYELLTGSMPFDSKTLREKSLEEMRRTLREVDPPKPSTRVVAPVLKGDLDWITMRALEKDRTRRYASVSDFAADLRRHLNHEPVVAGPRSTAYHARKFVRRHTAGVSVAAALMTTLAVFAGTTWVQARRIASERDRANKEAEAADRNRSEATKQAQVALNTIYEVVTKTDETLRPIAGTGPLRKALLDSAMKNLDDISRSVATSSWADRTMGVALQRMAEFYGQTGTTNQSVQALERSLQVFDRLMKDDPDQDWTAFDAAISYDSLGELGRETEPDPARIYHAYDESLKIRERLVEHMHQPEPTAYVRRRAVAASYLKVASLALDLHDPAKALGFAEKAVQASSMLGQLDSSKLNDSRDVLAQSNRVVGDSLVLNGLPLAARDAYRRAGDLLHKAIDTEPLNAEFKTDLGRVDLAEGDLEISEGNLDAGLRAYRTAEAAFTELIAKDVENLEMQWYRANVLYAIGRALRSAGRKDEGLEYIRQSLPIRKALLQSDPKNIQRRIELMLTNAQLDRVQETTVDAQAVEAYAPKNPAKLFAATRAYALLSASDAPSRAAMTSSVRKTFEAEALRLLRQAIAVGFRDRVALEHAQELAALRSSDEYTQLLSGLPIAPR